MEWIRDPNLVLYLPLYALDGDTFASKDQFGHKCTRTAAKWHFQGCEFTAGATEQINIPVHASLDISAAFTIMVWVKLNTTATNRAILCKRDAQAIQPFLLYSETPAGWTFAGSADGLTWGTVIQTTTRWNTTDWHFLAASHDGIISSLDIDNLVAEGTDTSPDNPQTGTGYAFIIGKRGAGQNLNGFLGEVMIFNRCLTPQQRQEIYRASKWRYA